VQSTRAEMSLETLSSLETVSTKDSIFTLLVLVLIITVLVLVSPLLSWSCVSRADSSRHLTTCITQDSLSLLMCNNSVT